MTRALTHFDLPVTIPSGALTLDGFRQWAASDGFPESGRISYINHGVILDMSPEDPFLHATAKAEISRVVGNLLRTLDLGVFFPDGVLLSNQLGGLSTEPDAMVASWATLENGKLRRIPAKGHADAAKELLGTPDWVLEVVSPSSIKKDTELLREAYHKAGVPEYWLVSALGKELQFDVLVWKAKGYEPSPVKAGWRRSPVFGRRFKLTRERNRIGDWGYTLHVGR